MLKRKAIALLITVFFVMLITISIGVGLKYVKDSSVNVYSEVYMLQSSVILEDVLKILKTSQDLEKIKSAQELEMFLSESSIIPFESNGFNVIIELSSARAKVNPNTFTNPSRLEVFKTFLMSKMLNIEYANILSDVIGGIKEDMSYNTDIFNKKPYLFRDYLTSHKHLEEVNDFYMKYYHDNNLKNIDMQKLFYISKDKNSSIDLNYATPLAWELMLGCDEDRAKTLSLGGGTYTAVKDIGLYDNEKVSQSKFQTSFFEPYIDVKIEIIKK